jgi:hypothetical protein
VALFGSKGDTRFDVVSPETGEDPQLLALELQAEAFAQHARGRHRKVRPLTAPYCAVVRLPPGLMASAPFGESALQAAFAAPGPVPGPLHRSWSVGCLGFNCCGWGFGIHTADAVARC